MISNVFEELDQLSVVELEKAIKKSSDAYYNSNSPIITDEIYDILIDLLKKKSPKSKVLGAVGFKPAKNMVHLDYWMGSMNKIKPNTGELEKWVKKYDAPYILSDKLDGVSALLIYRASGKINLYTRGTGNTGTDITPLIKYLNIPKDLRDVLGQGTNEDVAFRGELIIKKETFARNWASIMKNARNTVSGLVNSKTIDPNLANDTSFIVYEVVNPVLPLSNQLKIIKALKMDCVNYTIVNELGYDGLSHYLKKRRTESPFDIDGIIVGNNENHTKNTGGNPEYAFAYKDVLDDQKATTQVMGVEWNISKDGYIKPTVIISPVFIGGVEINRVTGHNAKNIIDNNIGSGAIIEIIRSGDVIPYIQRVVKSGTVVLPETEWHWNKSNVDIIMDDLNSKDQLVKNIHYFFSKLEAKGIGPKLVETLIDGGLDTVQKILASKSTDFIQLERIQRKTADNIESEMKRITRDIPLELLMTASNTMGHSIGMEKIKKAVKTHPDLLTKPLTVELLNQLDGFDTITSSQFIENLGVFKSFYSEIKDLITLKGANVEEEPITDNIYNGKVFVFSGFRDAELEKRLEKLGAKINNSVSKNTDYLVVVDDDLETSKAKKAIELGVIIVKKGDLIL
jgi:DNA ligase (NAD+)